MMDRSYLKTLPVRSMRRLLAQYADTLNPDEIATLRQEMTHRKFINCLEAITALLAVIGIVLLSWYVHFNAIL